MMGWVMHICLSLMLTGFGFTSAAESYGLMECTHHPLSCCPSDNSAGSDAPIKHLDCSCTSHSGILISLSLSFSGSRRTAETLSLQEISWPRLGLSPHLEPPRLI